MAEIGSIVGDRYSILRQIGEGGMSRVYLAMDVNLNKTWAVKEIKQPKDPLERSIIVQAIATEANMIKRFDHPAIPRIVDIVDAKGVLYVVMDYVEGETLTDIISEQGPQSEADVVDWGLQLCEVLDYLHKQNPPVIYRDMKPSNLMIKPEGTVSLIDFGIAREYKASSTDEQKITDTVSLGTRGYAAPEQYSGDAQTDPRTDVYSLGATLYNALTNKSPAEEPYSILPIRQINPDLSAGLEKVISKATQQNPDDRYQSMAEFAYDLEHYQEIDDATKRRLKTKWGLFVASVSLCALFLVGGIATRLASSYLLEQDYDDQLQLALKETDQERASKQIADTVSLKPEDTRAYHSLINVYRSDFVFDSQEERQLLNELVPNLSQVRNDSDAYADLSFELGKLYWYYYEPNEGTTIHERMMAARPWMLDASRVSTYEKSEQASIYSNIADFNSVIVPRINEGDDAGLYKPYFELLKQLLVQAEESQNEVLMLSSAQLVQDALRTYPRKFRADNVSQVELEELLEKTQSIATLVNPTTDKLSDEKASVMQANAETQTAITNAFVDVGV